MSTESERAKMRPKNFDDLSPAEQWEVDKSLGILDYAGEEPTPPKFTAELKLETLPGGDMRANVAVSHEGTTLLSYTVLSGPAADVKDFASGKLKLADIEKKWDGQRKRRR